MSSREEQLAGLSRMTYHGKVWVPLEQVEAILSQPEQTAAPLDASGIAGQDQEISRTYCLVPKGLKCHKCGASEPWKDPSRDEVASVVDDPKTWEGIDKSWPPAAPAALHVTDFRDRHGDRLFKEQFMEAAAPAAGVTAEQLRETLRGFFGIDEPMSLQACVDEVLALLKANEKEK